MTTTTIDNVNNTPAMPVTPPHRGGGREGVPTFQTNETFEHCKMMVSQDGRIEVQIPSYYSAELERMGKPEKVVRGRMNMVDTRIIFAPYAEASRKPTFERKVVVGGTTLAVTNDKVKVSFLVPRHLSKAMMTLYIQSEIDEVKRRLVEDVYDEIVAPL